MQGGAANDFFHTFSNFISGKNILSNILGYIAAGALILLLIFILPCIVRILRQNIQKLATELHLAVLRNKKGGPRGFSRVAAAFSSYDGDLSLPLGLSLGSPIFPSSCKGNLGVALASF